MWAPEQFVSETLIAPGLAVLAIVAGILLSIRSSDVRVAQRLSGLIMLPVFIAAALPSFRVVRPTVSLFVVTAAVIWAIDAAGIRALARAFDRERLITRFG